MFTYIAKIVNIPFSYTCVMFYPKKNIYIYTTVVCKNFSISSKRISFPLLKYFDTELSFANLLILLASFQNFFLLLCGFVNARVYSSHSNKY